jgi:hypothetical protein
MAEPRTVSVRLDPEAGLRLDRASALMHQSRAAFLEKAGDEAARRVLTEWAARRYRQGAATFSELAEQTGLAVEEIMEHLGGQERGAALEMFLASCRAVAETQKNRRFLRLAEQAVASLGGAEPLDGPRSAGAGRSKATEALSLREPRAAYVTPAEGAVTRWRVDGNRLTLRGVSDTQRRRVDDLIAEFGRVKPGAKGGSAALAAALASEWEAGFLSRGTVERLARWCHSAGPGYRGRPQQAARALSEALFGTVVSSIDRSPAGDETWHSLAAGTRS